MVAFGGGCGEVGQGQIESSRVDSAGVERAGTKYNRKVQAQLCQVVAVVVVVAASNSSGSSQPQLSLHNLSCQVVRARCRVPGTQ